MNKFSLLTTGALAAVLAACTQQGDFGRPRHALPIPELAFTGAQLAKLRHEPVSNYRLSDDEQRMRALAFRFLRIPGEDGFLGSALSEYRLARIIPLRGPYVVPSSYYITLSQDQPRSSTTIWARLKRDIRADDDMIAPFASQAWRVVLADESRLQASYETEPLEVDDLSDVTARVAENHRLILAVCQAQRERIAAYAYAIDKARLEVPDGREHETYLALVDLQRRAGLCDEVSARYEAVLAASALKGAGKGPGIAPRAPIERAPPPVTELR